MTNARQPVQTALEASPSAKPRTYTVEQAAKIMGISRSTAYECVRLGTLPSLRFRRRIVIPANAIERLLDAAGPVADAVSEPS